MQGGKALAISYIRRVYQVVEEEGKVRSKTLLPPASPNRKKIKGKKKRNRKK